VSVLFARITTTLGSHPQKAMLWGLYINDQTINTITLRYLTGVCACLFQDVVNGYQCNCAVGWTGTNCDVNINDCTPSSCLNGGLCHVSCTSIAVLHSLLNQTVIMVVWYIAVYVCDIESVASICRDSTDMQYMIIQKKKNW